MGIAFGSVRRRVQKMSASSPPFGGYVRGDTVFLALPFQRSPVLSSVFGACPERSRRVIPVVHTCTLHPES